MNLLASLVFCFLFWFHLSQASQSKVFLFALFTQIMCILILAPKLFPFNPKSSLKLGAKFRILCQTEEEADYRFTWHKNGHPLLSNAKYRIESSQDQSQLTIAPIDLDDSANFSCTVSDGNLKDTQATQLEVKGKCLFVGI